MAGLPVSQDATLRRVLSPDGWNVSSTLPASWSAIKSCVRCDKLLIIAGQPVTIRHKLIDHENHRIQSGLLCFTILVLMREGEGEGECQPARFDVTGLTLSGIYSRVHIPI